jgi:ABC-2 type transport system ATP-binding protein
LLKDKSNNCDYKKEYFKNRKQGNCNFSNRCKKRMTEVVIQLENVCKKFGSFTAVNNINLTIKQGEIVGFIGPNGAGKTTTLKLIARLMRPTSGNISIINKQGNLQDIFEHHGDLVEMGFLLDIPHFYNVTPYRLLKYIANLRNYPKKKIQPRMDHLLKAFNLVKWKHKKIKTFSKGMVQKLGFIAAVIHDPEIILLDEPQTGLDPSARIDVRTFMRALQNQGKTIFVASHMIYEITEVCDKIALLFTGEVKAFDTIDNLGRLVKSKEIICDVVKPIPSEKIAPLLLKLRTCLEPYLDTNLDPSVSKDPIVYKPQEKKLIVYFDGKEESQAKILEILVNQFKTEFTIKTYSIQKASQLERLYTQMIRY